MPQIFLLLFFTWVAAWPASAQVRPWSEYRTIMWLGDTAYKQPDKLDLFFTRLGEMGINTGMVTGDADVPTALRNHFPYYVENIVNRGLCLKFNSNVKDWDKFVTEWSKGGRPDSALVRDYCLDDPAWLKNAQRAVQAAVRKHEPNNPIAYNLRDELSVTLSANPFDYDFNPLALAEFRKWLKEEYAELPRLNAEWETDFKSWDEVKPFTTDQIKNRMASGDRRPQGQPDWQALQRLRFDPAKAGNHPTRWNFAPWADFRTYMDISLARTLDRLRQAAHQLDPKTPVGIEGTQMPSAFGGYDLWRLSRVLDWVEPYDIGNAREILGSFMPRQAVMTTVFEAATNPARRRLWHLLLEGDRGCIVWWSEDCIDWKSADYPLTPKARALAPALKEMTSPLARLFLGADLERDRVYIHYSQPSIQVDWLMESTVDGPSWLRRFSSYEGEHNRQAKVRNGWVKALQDAGYTPRFISSPQIEQGELRAAGNAVLVMPQSWALSAGEAAELHQFLNPPDSGTSLRQVICDGPVGMFDEHGKLAPKDPFNGLAKADLFVESTCVAVSKGGRWSQANSGAITYTADRLKSSGGSAWSNWLAQQLQPLPPEVRVSPNARARVYRYLIPRGLLVAVERDVDYHMSEDLISAGGNEALERPITTELTLATPMHVYDLRSAKYAGSVELLPFTLEPWQPSLFALLKEPLPPGAAVETLLQQSRATQ